MTKVKVLYGLCIAMLVLLLAQPVLADNQKVTQEIQAEYMKADSALRTKDINALMAHYSPDFKLKVSANKVLGREKVKDLVVWQFVATKEVKELSFRIQSVTVKGDTVVVQVRQTQSLIVVMDKKPHSLVSVQTSSDTWVKTPAGWKLKYQEVLQNSTLEDGKSRPQVAACNCQQRGLCHVA